MLTANDLMTTNPITVHPDTPLREIIQMMHNEGCRHIPVLVDGQLVGMVTDRDVRLSIDSPLVQKEVLNRPEIVEGLTAAGCMTTDLITVTPETPFYQIADILSIYKFGALPVVDQGELVGIVSVTDLLNYLAGLKDAHLIGSAQARH